MAWKGRATATAATVAVTAMVAGSTARSGLAGDVDFVRDVRPILQHHCYSCHGPERQKSGLRFDVKAAALAGGEYHAPAIVPGKPGASNLLRFVRGDDPDRQMPPEGGGLSKDDIGLLERWIEEGASWPDGIDEAILEDPMDHWSFQPLRHPDVPEVRNPGWARNEIDEFVLSRLEGAGLAPSPEAGKLDWLRRVYFDLTGLPPSPDDVEAFLQDSSGDAWDRVVDSLLDSPRYGERWAQHWLDVVRYADTHGFEVNTPRPNAWPYRDYVIDAFNRDTPWDRFVLEQIAGDAVNRDAATGFLVTAAALLPGQIGKDDESKRLARQDELGEILTNVGEAFLGLSIGCARCHDHKFDPVSAEEYYSLQAFFAGVDYGERPVVDAEAESEAASLREEVAPVERQLTALYPVAGRPGGRESIRSTMNQDRFEPVAIRSLRFTILETNKLEPCLDEIEIFEQSGRNVALASRGAKTTFSGSRTAANRHEERFVNDGLYGNSRSWMSNETGEGWVRFDFAEPVVVERVAWGRDRTGKFRDRLATRYRIEVKGEGEDEGDEWRVVASHEDRAEYCEDASTSPHGFSFLDSEDRDRARTLVSRRDAIRERLSAYPDGGRLIFAGKFRTPGPVHWLRRGDPEQPQDEVVPAVPAFLGGWELDASTPDRERRLALARWIGDPAHPLTARVIVNRVWLGHFGNGLVETANDFGNAGAEPSHPDLLDWLAAEFIRTGWSLKRLHRLIVLSATYRQSSLVRSEGVAVDAGDRLLWRYPSRRLEAEAIRDSMLAVSGRLNPERGGPGFDLFRSRGGLSGFPPVESFDKEGRRRMIYAHKIRMEKEAVFGAFDCPDAGQSLPRRRQSTTPLQALNLFNSTFTLEEARAWTERLREEAGASPGSQVERAWLLAFGREPESEETVDAINLVREHGLEALCRALYNTNEFLFLP